MDLSNFNILTYMMLIPLIGAGVILFIRNKDEEIANA